MNRLVAFTVVGCAAVLAGAIALAAMRLTGGTDVRAVNDTKELTRIGDEALALVDFPASRVGYEVQFAPGRPEVRAETDRTTDTIRVFVRSGDAPHMIAHDLAHELGHAYDDARMSESDRRDYLARRGVPGAEWFPNGTSDYAVGAGDFAEVFALCHAASPDFRSELAGRPAQACELLPVEAL